MIRALKDTKICQQVSTGLYTEIGFDVPADFVDKLLDVVVTATTEALNSLKSTSFPVVFKYQKPNKDFICAAMVQYFPNTDDETKPGNWNYSWTFNEADIPENASVHTPYDNELISFFRGTSISKYGFNAKESVYYGDVAVYILQTVKKWLDDNALESEENGASIDGIIQFRVSVENGEKIFAAEPDGEIKQLIKDDAKIEV